MNSYNFPKIPRKSSIRSPTGRAPPKPKEILSSSPDSWKPPAEWECLSDDPKTPTPAARKTGRGIKGSSSSDKYGSPTPGAEVTDLRRNIRRMQVANPRIMLERIKEEWTEVSDPTIYKELELDKHLWVLTALKFLVNKIQKEADGSEDHANTSLVMKAPMAPSKVLMLYENQGKSNTTRLNRLEGYLANIHTQLIASSCFTAAFTTALETHHLSTSPLPPSVSSIPNIYPITVPNPHHTLPYGPLLFSSITCGRLPVIIPSSSIPPLLKECHRILAPSGILHLTIMDPSPAASTLGPLFRTWLENNLLHNLEKQFRCTSPGRLLPMWLQKAGFSFDAEGGMVTMIRFPSMIKEDGGLMELIATVGRMLWKDMWGAFVEGESWWWEDDDIMQECQQLGTRWDCAVVKATKCS
jgi:hypothetical protein